MGISEFIDILIYYKKKLVVSSSADDNGLDSSTWKELRQQTTHTLNTMNLGQEEKIELVATLALFEQLCTLANLLALDPTQP